MSSLAICHTLTTPEERERAREIVRRTYAAQGYDTTRDSIGHFLETPGAQTFGLFEKDLLYGTISIVPDSIHGLPMDVIYREELQPLRAHGRQIAEVVQFAVDHDAYATVFGKKPSPFDATPLFAAVLAQALEKKSDYLCIAINPKHDMFYSMLGFKKIGELKHYGSVEAPAIARAFYVPEWRSQKLIAHFLGKNLPAVS